MSKTVIQVENLSKQYRLGQVGTGTLSHDINRWWHRIRGKEDPYSKVGEENDRTVKANSEYVWALKDINFEITQGEVVGIIGRNGAGKSTLLKILSRTTSPTTGSVKVKGRIASLLEVGTGFHPELSGQENIFMNGAILGMSKQEIKQKFDEIVDFAGVERYIDTPVKRYSSGMYVRLAFAVAAHLEPEILIVDEVLAVGDSEFQGKALGKMRDVSKTEGRTVLFVSHNLDAIKFLTSNSILLSRGKIQYVGNTLDTLQHYRSSYESQTFIHKKIVDKNAYISPLLEVKSISVNNKDTDTITLSEFENEVIISIEGIVKEEVLRFSLEVRFLDVQGTPLAFYAPGHVYNNVPSFKRGHFSIKETITLPKKLTSGDFKATINLSWPNHTTYFAVTDAFFIRKEGFPCENGRRLMRQDVGWILL